MQLLQPLGVVLRVPVLFAATVSVCAPVCRPPSPPCRLSCCSELHISWNIIGMLSQLCFSSAGKGSSWWIQLWWSQVWSLSGYSNIWQGGILHYSLASALLLRTLTCAACASEERLKPKHWNSAEDCNDTLLCDTMRSPTCLFLSHM